MLQPATATATTSRLHQQAQQDGDGGNDEGEREQEQEQEQDDDEEDEQDDNNDNQQSCRHCSGSGRATDNDGELKAGWFCSGSRAMAAAAAGKLAVSRPNADVIMVIFYVY